RFTSVCLLLLSGPASLSQNVTPRLACHENLLSDEPKRVTVQLMAKDSVLAFVALRVGGNAGPGFYLYEHLRHDHDYKLHGHQSSCSHPKHDQRSAGDQHRVSSVLF